MICSQKQFLSPEFLKLIGLMFDKKYAERKYTLFFMSIYFIRISRLKFAKFENKPETFYCEKNII